MSVTKYANEPKSVSINPNLNINANTNVKNKIKIILNLQYLSQTTIINIPNEDMFIIFLSYI